jgi:hypothetical protein
VWRFIPRCAKQVRARAVKDKVTRTCTLDGCELTGSWFTDDTSDCHTRAALLRVACKLAQAASPSIGGAATKPAIAWLSCASTSSAMVITPISNVLKSILARLF